jgi:hypothetical protein
LELALAILVYDGAESGDMTAALATSGTMSVQSSVVHSGDYAYRVNPTAAGAYISFNSIANTGLKAAIAGNCYATFWLYFTALPTSGVAKIHFTSSVNVTVGRYMSVDSSGQVQLNAAGTVHATLTTGQWYLVEFSVTSTTTSVSVDGAAALTFGAGGAPDRLLFGDTASATFDMIFDDVVLSNSGHVTTPHITRLLPTGAGTYSGWTNGTGSTYAEVDEVPHDSNTTYIQNTSGTNVEHTFAMQSRATAGAAGAVAAVMAYVVMAEASSTSTSGRVMMRSGSTDAQGLNTDIGTTAFVPMRLVREVDPATSSAWTGAAVDAVEIGVDKDSDNSAIRCTAVYAMVLTDGVDPIQEVDPDGIEATSDTGDHQVNSGIGPGGIAAGPGAGTPVVSPQAVTIGLDGIAAASQMGELVATFGTAIPLDGIAAGSAAGTPIIRPQPVTIEHEGIDSTAALGAQVLSALIQPTGVQATPSLGSHVLAPGAFTIEHEGISSGAAVGDHQLNLAVVMTGIASGEVLGALVVEAGSVTIAPDGVASGAGLGALVVLLAVTGLGSPPAGTTYSLARLAAGSSFTTRRPPGGRSGI